MQCVDRGDESKLQYRERFPLRVRRMRPSTSDSCLGAARACAKTSRDNLHVSLHGRAADHLVSPKVVAFGRHPRLGLPVRAPLYGRPFQVPEVRLARVTLFAASGRGRPSHRGIFRRQRNVSSIWTSRSRLGSQPSLRCDFSMLPTRRGESPGRRGPTVCGTG